MFKFNTSLKLVSAVVLQSLCHLPTLASAATISPTATSSDPIHLARRQLFTASPTFDVPPFAKDMNSTVTTITTAVIVVWVVSLLGSLCLLCALGYCILAYTRRQKEKSRMSKERHQMEMEAWRQQQQVYGAPAGSAGPGVQLPPPAYGGHPQQNGMQQHATGQQQGHQAYGRQG